MHPRFSRSRCLLAAASLTLPASALSQARPAASDIASFDAARLTGMRYRMIGPARGGRVTAVTGVNQEPHTFYMGATGGGVWKTTDAGITWRSLTDQSLATASIGALDVADTDSNIVYVGTGSEAIRSNVSIGKGIYKSTDAGRSWRFVGLRDAGQIGAVVTHPSDPDLVYAAVVGNPFAVGPTRGVYRTRDGGASWQRVLFLSDSTGAVDLELQPGNPNVVYASMWHGARRPWTIVSGGAEDGIYRSIDGGDHWTKLGGGLPTGVFGKSDLAVSAAAPLRVYALVEAKPGSGLYRSDDAGEHWTLINTTPGLITRPFYYDNVDADPTNADVVYVGTEGFYKSTDGGRTFRTMRTPHGDNHDMWINPRDGRIFIQSNDGGANVTLNGGSTWSTQENQPTAEIYQVAVDDQYPYRVYGAQQDNSTLIVPSLPVQSSALDDPIQSWRQGPGCETGPIIPNRLRPDTVYGGCKGQWSRMSLRAGQERQYWIGAQSLYGNANQDLRYRFQRVSPMEVSPHEPATVYYGSQFVHRTRDEGVTWERISPDLTANDPRYRGTISGEPITIDVTGEEMYATLYAIRESPVTAGVIWTGANDGPIYVTRDNGKSWTNVTPRDLPPGGRVQNIEPSPHRAGAAYVAVLRYLLGDFQPYLYKTEDYGKTWTRLTDGRNGIPADAPTRVVREDPDRPGLLYAGTEFGMYVSFDDGAHWRSFQLNLPVTPVTDIRVHRQDLVLSTQGRAFWILDDLTPLHQLSDAVAAERGHLFAPREGIRYRYRAAFGGIEGDRGVTDDAPQYPPPGAMIDYWLSSAGEPVTIEITDARNALVRSFSSDSVRDTTMARAGTPRLTTRAGLNRLVWDMNYPGPWNANPAQRGRNGPMAAPGQFTVRITAGGRSVAQPLRLRADPRALRDGITQRVLDEQLAFDLRVRDLVSDANRTAEELRAMRLRATGGDTSVAPSPAIAALERELFTPPIRYSRPALLTHITYLYGMTLGADQPVSRDAYERYAELRAALDDLKRRMAVASVR
ncbi:MAG: WD40/YVTN/BNR-like repeat-containing protein [Gemmatimonadaceae bacterium]